MRDGSSATITVIAPVNIATIKYWGKRDETLILPCNDSISATLDTQQLHAKTTITAKAEYETDKIFLNGIEESIFNERIQSCLRIIRERAKEQKSCGDMYNWKIRICSENNFPTACGLASSAAGYAALVYAYTQLLNVKGDVTDIARRGSGSACRSLSGGFVRWNKGELSNGQDSIATNVVPASHWPELRIIILVVNDQKKKVSSSKAMKMSVETSELLKYRVSHCVPERTDEMVTAIADKNFTEFAKITMRDSNQFHAICLDTYPPVVYMNDVSHAIVSLVQEINDAETFLKVGYTFDAGPNACLFTLEEYMDSVLGRILSYFPPGDNNRDNYVRGLRSNKTMSTDINYSGQKHPGLLKYVLCTKLGNGPEVLPADCRLVAEE